MIPSNAKDVTEYVENLEKIAKLVASISVEHKCTSNPCELCEALVDIKGLLDNA